MILAGATLGGSFGEGPEDVRHARKVAAATGPEEAEGLAVESKVHRRLLSRPGLNDGGGLPESFVEFDFRRSIRCRDRFPPRPHRVDLVERIAPDIVSCHVR